MQRESKGDSARRKLARTWTASLAVAVSARLVLVEGVEQ
jgi:hypothetical protein